MRFLNNNHISLHRITIDELWSEAEQIGAIKVWPKTEGFGYHGKLKGYSVTIYFYNGKTKVEVECDGPNLCSALSDAINEARRMGAGEVE